MKNPALRQESRYEPAAVIPVNPEPSLLDWLYGENRIIPRENKEVEDLLTEDEDISELMDDDNSYNSDDDDFDGDDLDD